MNNPYFTLKQHNKTNQHYKIAGLAFDAPGPAGTKTRKNVFTVPDFTNGIDALNCEFFVELSKIGDRILEAKGMVGQVGVVIAVSGNTVTLRAPKGVLKNSASGGILDEGLFLSFGLEEFSESNPLAEFQIKRISDPVSASEAYDDTIVELFTPATPSLGSNCNLNVHFVENGLELQGEDYINIGGQTFASSPMPVGSKIQVYYERNGASTERVRAKLVYMY